MNWIKITVTLFILAAGGCTTGRDLTLAQAPMSPVLLYDAHGGWPSAGDMGRSTWPSTASYQSQEEQVFYTERFIDVQRAGPHSGQNHDYVYRRFSTRRVGRARR